MPPLLHNLRTFLSGDGVLILPELELLLFALGVLVIDRWLTAKEKYWNAVLALVGVGFSGFTLHVQHGKMAAVRAADPQSPGIFGFGQNLLVDPFFLFFTTLFLAALALIILFSLDFREQHTAPSGFYYALLLVACAGLMLMVGGINMIAIFTGLQFMAISSYALLRFAAERSKAEAAKRSFSVLWTCSSVALALGFLLLYGEFRTGNLGRIGAALETRLDKGTALAGLTTWHSALALALLATGALFLLEAAPWHWLAPEIYDAAPAPVAGFLAAAAKAAGLALLLRLFVFLFFFAQQKWIHVWGGVAILSLLWGNIAALRQRHVLRILAQGAVMQAGFAALGLVAANETALEGVVYHIGAYVFGALGIFGVLIVLQQEHGSGTTLADLRGLHQKSPALAWLLLLFALTLAGVPLCAGFVAKYYIVKGVFAGHPELAVFAAVNALFSAYVYGRMAAQAFRSPALTRLRPQQTTESAAPTSTAQSEIPPSPIPSTSEPRLILTIPQTFGFTIAAFVSLAAGLYPAPFLRIASYVFGQ